MTPSAILRRVNWRIRVALAPLWAVFVFVLAVSGVTLLGLWGYRDRSLIGVVVLSLGVALAVTAGSALGRRREQATTGVSTREDRIMLMRAMQTGEAPPDRAFDQALLRTVTKRRAAYRHLPWYFTIIALMQSVLAIAGHQTFWVVLVCLWVVLTACAWAEWASTKKPLARLEQALRERA